MIKQIYRPVFSNSKRHTHIKETEMPPAPTVNLVANNVHDDVIKLKRFPRYWPFVRGVHQWPVNSPHKSQWRGALISSLICAWTNGWVNTRDAGDLRLHRAHYDVTVMAKSTSTMRFHWWIYRLLWRRIPASSGALRLIKAETKHYNDVIMSVMASQITGVSTVSSNVGSGANQRKHQSSASLAFVREIHRWPVNFPHKRSVTRKIFRLMTSSW